MVLIVGFILSALVPALWMRRDTWRSRWEITTTLSIATLIAALLLMGPVGDAGLGRLLPGDCEDCVGHVLLVMSAGFFLIGVYDRLLPDMAFGAAMRWRMQQPARLCIVAMLAIFTFGDVDVSAPADRFEVATAAYWAVFCGIMVYLLGQACYGLLFLRADPRQRGVATVHLIAAACGVLTFLALGASMTARPLIGSTGEPVADAARLLRAVWMIGMATAAAYSWRAKRRQLAGG